MSVQEVARNSNLRVRKVTPKKGDAFYVIIKVNGTTERVVETDVPTLKEAREIAGIAYNPPEKLTKPRSAYSQYTGTSKVR